MLPRTLWCERALLPSGIAADVAISIVDDAIAGVDVGVDPPAHCIPLRGLTLPGFANAHSHAFHRALRGRTHAGPGDFWSWREQMYAVAAQLTPENYRELARATFAEMVLAGYTVVGEFHYVHHQPDGTPYDDANAMGRAVMAAAADAGIRLTLLDACYLRGGAGVVLDHAQRRFGDGSAAAWADRVDRLARAADGSTVRVGAAIHSVRAVDAGSIAAVAAFAEQRSMPLHAHVSEQVGENDQVAAEHGCSPTQLLARQGALSPRFTAVHATHLNERDVLELGGASCTCCFCPTTERDLADGIGPSTELVGAGVRLAIGSDQHAVIDPFAEIRALEMNERLRTMRRGNHSSATLLAVGSANGYACLGWPDGGAIAVGALADLTTIGLGSPRLAGAPVEALADAVVFAGTATDVTDVFVAGRHVVAAGRHTTVDVAAALQDSIDGVVSRAGTHAR